MTTKNIFAETYTEIVVSHLISEVAKHNLTYYSFYIVISVINMFVSKYIKKCLLSCVIVIAVGLQFYTEANKFIISSELNKGDAFFYFNSNWSVWMTFHIYIQFPWT